MLSVESFEVHRSGSAIIRDLSLRVAAGEVLGILGQNGAGKTTLAEAIVGVIPAARGTVALDDVKLTGRTPDRILRFGVALVPEGRQLFPSMTVRENLALGSRQKWRVGGPPASAYERVHDLFPALADMGSRKVGDLSGGQLQMVALGRALMGEPRILILDEPSFGLSPNLTADLAQRVGELATAGMGVLLIEQNIDMVLDIATTAALLRGGQIVARGDPLTITTSDQFVGSMFGALEAEKAEAGEA